MTEVMQDNALERLEEFLAELPEQSSGVAGLLREHLAEARFYLHGSMPQEYALILKLAEGLLPDLTDEKLRRRIAEFLRSQQAGQAAARRIAPLV